MFLDSSGFPLFGLESSSVLVHQSLDCFVVVCGCADNGSVRHWVLCVFFRKCLCVGLMFWIRVVVGSMFRFM